MHYRPTDDWTFHAKVGYTHGVGLTPEQPAWEGDAQTAASYNFAAGGPAVVTFPSINTSDPSALGNDWSWNDKFTAVDREYYGQADATWNINTSVLNSVEAGVRYAEHKRTVLGYDHGTFVGGTFAGVSTGHYPNDYADGFKVPGLLVGLPLGDPTKIAAAVEPNTPFLSPWFYWPGSFGVKEGDLAGYVQANVGADKWNGNFGVRVVQTADTIDQYVSDAGGISNLYGNYSIDAIKHTYVDVLPSANLNIDLTEDSKLRFAAAETMARPDYSALGGSVALTDLNLTGNGGNPDLKPIKAATYNASYEWYYGPQSLLSVALFYNDLSSYVSYATHMGTYVNATLTAGHGVPVYSVYTISSPINSSGYVQGVELSWQQPFWDDFGIIANYTYADGADNNGGPLVGELQGHVQRHGLLRSQRPERAPRLHLPFEVPPRSRPQLGRERAGDRLARCVHQLRHHGQHRADLRCAEPDGRHPEVLRGEHVPAACLLRQRPPVLPGHQREELAFRSLPAHPAPGRTVSPVHSPCCTVRTGADRESVPPLLFLKARVGSHARREASSEDARHRGPDRAAACHLRGAFSTFLARARVHPHRREYGTVPDPATGVPGDAAGAVHRHAGDAGDLQCV